MVHLAGRNVASRRWTAAEKAEITQSRIVGSRTLVDWLGRRAQKPAVLVAASATGLYGDRGDEVCAEDTPPGAGFLAGLVADWEAELQRAAGLGIRVVILRLGIVLSPDGGALGKMLPPFRLGLGGPMGDGRQWQPWIHIDDAVGMISWALDEPSVSGTYNAVAPNPARQAVLARALGAALGRPAFLPVPALALRLLFGEMADEALLVSRRAAQGRALAEGFVFRWPDLEPALEDILGQ